MQTNARTATDDNQSIAKSNQIPKSLFHKFLDVGKKNICINLLLNTIMLQNVSLERFTYEERGVNKNAATFSPTHIQSRSKTII